MSRPPVGAPDDPDATVRAAVRGSAEAVTALYRWLTPGLVRYLEAQAPGHGDDLAAETWISAGRTLAGFDGDADAFRGWLFTAARRQLVAHWRRRAARPKEVADLGSLGHAADRAELPEESVVEAMASAEAVAVITRSLPPDQAEVLLLRVVAGLDAAQVGEVLGKRPGTVRVVQHRALQRLKEVLDGTAALQL
ncbi:MAG TPA: sigma-70 family RNA polymerase sigma factor [Acidimicrobiales bacterium]|nr:sigma-70 family RNA polymerase sigma factor [Acidimicrobiales bacterium]